MEINNTATPVDSVNPTHLSSIQKQSEIIRNNKAFLNLMQSLSQMIVVLNKDSQIIYANKLYYDFCNVGEQDALLGMRPGEAFNCGHAFLTKQGCGSTDFCKMCGANNAISESFNGLASSKECRIVTQTLESRDIQVKATPYEIEGNSFTIFALMDISNKKRKESLERIFFHDILNSAGGISGLSSALLEINDPDEINSIADIMNRAAEHMVEEIEMQRQISQAERNELEADVKEISSIQVLNDLKAIYDRHKLVSDKTIVISQNSIDTPVKTDPTLLRRVLGNMIKNALEVYNPNSEITIGSKKQDESTVFFVHNSKFMQKDIQLQLFKRSFTTKGQGRGLGTYSMKLLGEKYLKGKVGFETSVEEGTTFYIQL